MPRTVEPEHKGNGSTPPALGNNGGKGKSTSRAIGHLLLPMKTNRSFSPFEARFITEFLKDPTVPTETIAIRAGYSPHSAACQGSQIINRPHVKAEIADQMHAFVQRERLSIQRLVRHLIELAEVDKRDFYNDNGSLKDPKDWTKPMASLVNGFTVAEIYDSPGAKDKVEIGVLKKITLTDHIKAVTMLTKSLQGFVDRMEVKSQSLNVHEHNVQHRHSLDIDYTVLNEEELGVLKGIYETIKTRTQTKQAKNKLARQEGRA